MSALLYWCVLPTAIAAGAVEKELVVELTNTDLGYVAGGASDPACGGDTHPAPSKGP